MVSSTDQSGSDGDGGIEGLRFRVLELRRVPGAQATEDRTVEAPPLRVGEVSVAPGPIGVETTLDVVSGGVRALGSVDFAWTAPCRRCLEDADGAERAEFVELFVDSPESYVGDPDAESDPLPIVDGWIDLGVAVRDAILLGLPLAPLCSPECAGPDPEKHPVRSADSEAEPDETAEPALDPRWAALSDLDLGESDSDEA